MWVYLQALFFTHLFSFTLSLLVSAPMCMCVCYCTHMLALAWVCPLLAQVGVCLVFCVRADRMCDACQHAPGDERPEREWK